MGVGARIKEILREKEKTILWLSEKSGVSKNTLYAITKRDTITVRGDNIKKIAEALEVTVEYLLGLSQDKDGVTDYVADSMFNLVGFVVHPIGATETGSTLYRLFNYDERYYFYASKEEVEEIINNAAGLMAYELDKLKKTKEVVYKGPNSNK